MSLITLPKMFVSETEGWSDLARIHPSVRKLFAYFVAPMSLLPPLMHAYSQLANPGGVFPALAPQLSVAEAFAVGAVFFLIEVAAVALMAKYIQQMTETQNVAADYATAYTLAAVAPTPLWIGSLALLVPSLWFNLAIVAVAWVATVALIRHGVRPILRVRDDALARKLAEEITAAGVFMWIGLLVVMTLLLGLLVGLR